MVLLSRYSPPSKVTPLPDKLKRNVEYDRNTLSEIQKSNLDKPQPFIEGGADLSQFVKASRSSSSTKIPDPMTSIRSDFASRFNEMSSSGKEVDLSDNFTTSSKVEVPVAEMNLEKVVEKKQVIENNRETERNQQLQEFDRLLKENEEKVRKERAELQSKKRSLEEQEIQEARDRFAENISRKPIEVPKEVPKVVQVPKVTEPLDEIQQDPLLQKYMNLVKEQREKVYINNLD